MFTKNIAIYPTQSNLRNTAEELAQELNLPLVLHPDETYPYLLMLTPDYLGLQKTTGHAKPLIIDFFSKNLQYRIKNTSIKKEDLARAMGLKGQTHPKIIDTTGGLACDSFIIASLGFHIEILERSPIIHALLKNALERAKDHPVIHRLHLQHTDAITWLKQTEKPDIIYLDPMFPERKKTALSKQNMLIFHDIVGDDADASALLTTALSCATRRVVVKRPRLAAIIPAARVPSFSLKGSSSRFDVYLI